MLAEVTASSVLGLEAFIIKAEVDASRGIGKHVTVGLPDAAVKEGKERIEAALRNSGFDVSLFKRITVNLAPADIRKEGPIFDLPIAVGILATESYIDEKELDGKIIIGELSLNGEVRSVRGVLPITIEAAKRKYQEIIVPKRNAKEASLIKGIKVIPVSNLFETLEHLTSRKKILPVEPEEICFEEKIFASDFSEVKGQYSAKRALEIAAAGGHNVLMVGSPGSGKTMLAKRFPSILPPLTYEEAIEVSKIYSITGLLKEGLITHRPFRSPHHTISDVGIVGGGQIPRPGEISLAHLGILFLDEFSEFDRKVLEVMRQPLEDGEVTICRALVSLTYPARFSLIAAMNPCACGFLMDKKKACSCTEIQITNYWKKISGPIMDRIDLLVEVPSLTPDELDKRSEGEMSAEIRKRVTGARKIQQERFKDVANTFTNSDMQPKYISKFCKMEKSTKKLLKSAADKLYLSARSYDRIIKVGRTIADLDGSDIIREEHIAEAIQLRISQPYNGQ